MSEDYAPEGLPQLPKRSPPSAGAMQRASHNNNSNNNGAANQQQRMRSSSMRRPDSSGSNSKQAKQSHDRSVGRLRLSKCVTLPEETPVADAAKRLAAARADAALLTNSNGMLTGIITDKDVTFRVVAEGLSASAIPVAQVMTQNPSFCMKDSSAVEALRKMVEGKFRHLPVVDKGEVVALLDITKVMYDAIARLERAADKSDALAAAVSEVEREWADTNDMPAPISFLETMRELVFRPTLKVAIKDMPSLEVPSSASVSDAAKVMKEKKSAAVVVKGDASHEHGIRGILTSKDILLRVVAQGMSPDVTCVTQVMTPNPECASAETTIVDALHIMHDGRFLHLPVVGKGGKVSAVVDVLMLVQAALSQLEGRAGSGRDAPDGGILLQKFWDSTLANEQADDDDKVSMSSLQSDHPHIQDMPQQANHSAPPSEADVLASERFTYKIEDSVGRVHRFQAAAHDYEEVVGAVTQRLEVSEDEVRRNLKYIDDEGDEVSISCDADLTAAVALAKSLSSKILRLQVFKKPTRTAEKVAAEAKPPAGQAPPLTVEPEQPMEEPQPQKVQVSSSYFWLGAGAVVAVVGVGVFVALRQPGVSTRLSEIRARFNK